MPLKFESEGSAMTFRVMLAFVCWAGFLPMHDVLSAVEPQTYKVGAAKVDITPAYPIRLSGFGFRRTESEGVTQKIWAKALAIDDGEPAVLIAVDNLGVPSYMMEDVAARLARVGIKRERFAVTSSHTHTAPMVKNVAPTLFGVPIPRAHQEHIDRYTRELAGNLEKVALAALANRRPATLSWGIGSVGFAANRRTRGGPVDHDLPMLVARDLQGKIRAIYVSYACHCVTLSNNKISGDWAGYAQESIESNHPGAIALVSVGCGGDANPSSGVTGDKVEAASAQGRQIAQETERLLRGYLTPVTGKLMGTLSRFDLPLAPLPPVEVWKSKSQGKDAVAYHARVQLARLERGESLRTKIDYSVQTWTFGNRLAMIFLPGEVVVDYSLRLKRELDRLRLWVNAYANDDPCYIPSERVLREGGYEGGGAMIYYDVPVPFAAGLEDKIIAAVHKQIGKRFARPFSIKGTSGSLPLPSQQSQAALHPPGDLAVDLVAAEPLVADPVAIDWGPDAKLYVAEMYDYPSGLRNDYKPAGRVKVLEDINGDGIYDRATVFLDKIPFPTGITTWRKGVLVCAAPDILYAEDTDGDGKADVIKTLFTGFGTHNYQARVNSLEWGLDGWVYGSCGLFGGTIKSFNGHVVHLGDRDFRIKPDEGILEPAAGRTQQGRTRNDWGDWFGCDNSTLCRHYPLPDHYLRRNAHVAYLATAVLVPQGPDPNRLYPTKQDLQLFKLSGPAGRTTAACGLGIYRDDLLGKEYSGNCFTCEPVNLIVHRLILTPNGSTFSGRRAPAEQDTEFLGSTDNWFRPVQVRTGPDGGLWIVDMYRYVIEHPRWIPPADLKTLDVRAGDTLGRIYRIRPRNGRPRPVPRLDKLDDEGLVAALDSPNGWQRDMASLMLLWQKEAPVALLEKMVTQCPRPEARLHALCVVAGLGKLDESFIVSALKDENPGVRRHAVRLAGKLKQMPQALKSMVMPRDAGTAGETDPQVRLQLAFSLGNFADRNAGFLLAELARRWPDDPFLTSAVASSLNQKNIGSALVWLIGFQQQPPAALVREMINLAVVLKEQTALPKLMERITAPEHGRFAAWQWAALEGALLGLQHRGLTLDDWDLASRTPLRHMLTQARVVADKGLVEKDRREALRVLGYDARQREADLALLGKLLVPQNSAALQSAALAALARLNDERVAQVLARGWKAYTPAIRSQALDILLSRSKWQARLLDSIARADIPAAHIDLRARQLLLNHPNETLRRKAAQVFTGAINRNRQKVLDEYQKSLTLAGDAGRGRDLFAKHCAACHRIENLGHAVGPDLAMVANRTPQYLLTELLDPSRNVDSRYVEYVAATKNGQVFTGLLASETSTSVTLRGQEGKEQILLRADLEALQTTGKSLMPEGLEKELNPQAMADVMAFVAHYRSPKKLPGNIPGVVHAVDGQLTLRASTGEIYGNEIALEERFGNIGFWHGVDDQVTWSVQTDKEGRYDVYLDWACAEGSAGNTFVLEGVQPILKGKVAATGGWDQYRVEKFGTVTVAAGRQRITLRPAGPVLRGALLDLRGIYLVPMGQKPRIAH
jgi:putative membrane-bound dehydrogenase-like protein